MSGSSEVGDVWSGEIGVHQSGNGNATRSAPPQLFCEDHRCHVTEADAPVLLGNAKAEEAELAHLVEQLAGHGLFFFPLLYVRDDLPFHEVSHREADRLEIIIDVDRVHSEPSSASRARPALLLYSRLWSEQNR